jgi:hypothetical protein
MLTKMIGGLELESQDFRMFTISQINNSVDFIWFCLKKILNTYNDIILKLLVKLLID